MTEEYFFNPHGVCTNPKFAETIKDKTNLLVIKVARLSDGCFCIGYDYRGKDKYGCFEGSSSPCSKSGDRYKTEEDAVTAMLKFMSDASNTTMAGLADMIIKRRKQESNEKTQLSLW